MKRIIILLLLGCYLLHISAQVKESETRRLLDKVVWDDKMLNILIDSRFDAQSQFDKDSIISSGFKVQTLKLVFTGEIINGVTYKLRQRLNKVTDPMIRDDFSSTTELAWVAFDINKHWALTVGKQSVHLGTFEYDYDGADVYLSSMINSDFDLYKTGVSVAYKFGSQAVHFQIVNSDAPQFAVERYENKAFAFNALWVGSFLNDKIKTRYAYGLFEHTSSKFYGWLTLGTQLNFGKFSTELDYFLGSRDMDYGSIVGQSDLGYRHVQDQSALVNVYMKHGKWIPMIKAVWDKRFDKEFDKTAYERLGFQVALECYPFKEEVLKDLQFHVAYMNQTTFFKGNYEGKRDQNVNTILAGMRWIFKIK